MYTYLINRRKHTFIVLKVYIQTLEILIELDYRHIGCAIQLNKLGIVAAHFTNIQEVNWKIGLYLFVKSSSVKWHNIAIVFPPELYMMSLSVLYMYRPRNKQHPLVVWKFFSGNNYLIETDWFKTGLVKFDHTLLLIMISLSKVQLMFI